MPQTQWQYWHRPRTQSDIETGSCNKKWRNGQKQKKNPQHLAVSNYTGNCKAECRICEMKIWVRATTTPQRHLRTADPSVQLEESVPSLLQLPSTDPGTSAAASTDLLKTAGIPQPSVTQTKLSTLQKKWLQPNTKVLMMKWLRWQPMASHFLLWRTKHLKLLCRP